MSDFIYSTLCLNLMKNLRYEIEQFDINSFS